MTKKTKITSFPIIKFSQCVYVCTRTHTGYDEYTYLNPASVTLQLCPQIITYFVKIWLLMMHSIPLYG